MGKGHPKEEDPLKKTKGGGGTESGWKEKQEKQGDLLSWKPREDRVSRREGSAVALKSHQKIMSHDLWCFFSSLD